MRVRCIAIPHSHSNAVGTLELRNTASELVVYHLSISSQLPGHSKGPVTTGTQTRIPWAEVSAQRLGSDELLLGLGPHRTALSSFCLTRFSHRSAFELQDRRGRVVLTTLGMSALILLIGLLATSYSGSDSSLSLGMLTALGLVGALALLLLLVGLATHPRWGLNAPPSHQVLTEYINDLEQHLKGSVKVTGNTPFVAPTGQQNTRRRIVVSLGFGAVAAGVAFLLAAPPEPQSQASSPEAAAVPAAAPAVFERTLAVLPSPLPEGAPTPSLAVNSGPGELANTTHSSIVLGASCLCPRPDSPLWQEQIARLSPLVLAQHTTYTGSSSVTQLKLAIVNNGDRSLRRLAVSVLFRSSSKPEDMEVVRPLYFDGPLRPGHAIKWSVEGPGDSVEIVAPDLGWLPADGSETAPKDSFLSLTEANHRPVRLHAVRMLARLGAPEALPVANDLLSANNASERPYLSRVIDATRPLFACALNVPPGGTGSQRINGCLFNRGLQAQQDLSLRIRANASKLDVDQPTATSPSTIAEWTPSVRGTLQPGAGRRFEFVASLGASASRDIAQLELVAGKTSEFQ